MCAKYFVALYTWLHMCDCANDGGCRDEETDADKRHVNGTCQHGKCNELWTVFHQVILMAGTRFSRDLAPREETASLAAPVKHRPH